MNELNISGKTVLTVGGETTSYTANRIWFFQNFK
tara:strand:+ start:384 stop:485 length:102 start_codon:yes stop_codon:yes gene_type:complete